MKNEEEIEKGDPRVAKTWLIGIFCYLLVVLWLEPLIDFLLQWSLTEVSPQAIANLAERKEAITEIAFAIARSGPVLIFLWLGYQVYKQGRLPPKGLRQPFVVRIVKGQNAKMVGMMMLALSMLLLLRELGSLA